VSQATASQVDAETRRLVEEALDTASALLTAHRSTLDRLAERLCEHETVNGSEVTAMLAEDGQMVQDDRLAPDGGPWQDVSLWHEKASAAEDAAAADSVPTVRTTSGNGHDPKQGRRR
jgi:ectoine hydroxylase-related dioxygenase (phytanoyl-CoA dioxygenase family)